MNSRTFAVVVLPLALSLAPHMNAQEGEQIRAAVRGQTFEYISSFMSTDSKVVKGAPYAADTSNENVQVLADGNRIVHKNTTKLYRDSEGRTRREQTLDSVGPWSASGEARQLIFISDPVAGVSYTLDPSTKTAWKAGIFHFTVSGSNAVSVETHIASDPVMHEGAGDNMVFTTRKIETRVGKSGEPASKNVVKEQLGKRTFDGVEAEGTRTTVTIPAGQIGNEQPLSMVTESWYSAALQMVVRTETRDPRMGNSTYTVSNINRSEQPKFLFEIPSDYTLKEDNVKQPVRMLKRNEM